MFKNGKQKEVNEMEMRSKTKLIGRLSGKGLFGLANIVEAIYQRIPKSSNEVQDATVMDSTFSLRGFLEARKAMPEVEIQKAMAVISSRHQSGKSGGPH